MTDTKTRPLWGLVCCALPGFEGVLSSKVCYLIDSTFPLDEQEEKNTSDEQRKENPGMIQILRDDRGRKIAEIQDMGN